MAYLAGAVVMYFRSVATLREAPPVGARETLAVLLLCTMVAAMWPAVLLWRITLGRAREG